MINAGTGGSGVGMVASSTVSGGGGGGGAGSVGLTNTAGSVMGPPHNAQTVQGSLMTPTAGVRQKGSFSFPCHCSHSLLTLNNYQ